MSRTSLFSFERDEPPAWTVGELTAKVKATLERGFADVAVKGEISGLSRRDRDMFTSISRTTPPACAVLWKSDAERVVFDLHDGLAVTAHGRLTVYAPRGDYQMTVRRIEPEGLGPLELAFRQTVERLKAEGLFDADRKRPLPRFPRKIAVVTSPTGAAVRDFLQVTGRRWPLTDIVIVPAKVQGLGSIQEVCQAISLANDINDVDLLIVARGGGSLEDLWTFNEERVARAISGSRVPVISAIGHETDVTIADLAADFRALTPSEAGERCVPDAREIAQHLDRLGDRVARAGRARIDQARDRLTLLSDRAARLATRARRPPSSPRRPCGRA